MYNASPFLSAVDYLCVIMWMNHPVHIVAASQQQCWGSVCGPYQEVIGYSSSTVYSSVAQAIFFPHPPTPQKRYFPLTINKLSKRVLGGSRDNAEKKGLISNSDLVNSVQVIFFIIILHQFDKTCHNFFTETNGLPNLRSRLCKYTGPAPSSPCHAMLICRTDK